MFVDYRTGDGWFGGWGEPERKPKKNNVSGNTYRSSDIFACAARDQQYGSNVNPKKYGPSSFYQIRTEGREIVTPPSKMHRLNRHG